MTWILGAGFVAIGFTLFEQQAIRSGDIDKVEWISLLGNMILLGGALVLSVYLFSDLPLLHWIMR
jgi:hypothetical protein